MKNTKLILLILNLMIISLIPAFGQDFTSLSNPIIPNDENLPVTNGDGIRNSSDPTTITFMGSDGQTELLFLYTSCDLPARNSGGELANYPMSTIYCYSSEYDYNNPLTEWYDHGAAITESDFDWAEQGANHLWAPEITYTTTAGGTPDTFYLYVPALQDSDDTNGEDILRIGIATAENAYGPFTGLSDYLQINNAPNNGFAYDPSVYRGYLLYCDNYYPDGRLHIASMNSNMTSADYIGPITFKSNSTAEPPHTSIYMEGPELFSVYYPDTVSNMYYLVFAAKVEDDQQEYIGYAMATSSAFDADPQGCWDFQGWIMKDIDPNRPTEWTNHATIQKFGRDGNQDWRYYLFYQIGEQDDDDKNRRVCVQKINFDQDDFRIDGVSENLSLGHGSSPSLLKSMVLGDEGFKENNRSKVRIAIENSSDFTWTDFKARYYFTVENGKTPWVDDYWTPNFNTSLERINGDLWAVVLDYAGYTLEPGEIVPEGATDDEVFGEFFGLQYTDWSEFDKSNDFSQPEGNYYAWSDRIAVFNSNDELIYGRTPQEETEPVSLAAYILDEGYYESNMVKPRLYIENNGDSYLSDFKVHYYFTTENWLTPVAEDWWTPNCTVTLEHLGGNKWRAVLDYTGYTLEPGGRVPDNDGEIFGLHYSHPYWPYWDKTNDFSQPSGNYYTFTENIAIFNNNGELVYGSQPY